MSFNTGATLYDSDASFEESVYDKVSWRLIPFLFLCYVVAYLDRVNVGFAKIQMLNDLKFSETVYGLGAGIFFIGYFLFEVPSNIILHRVGARIWIARIMITWGLISAAMIYVTTPATFYILRFFLGVAEAGFFPGIILYLTYWYPAHRRARMTALFMSAIPVSGVIGGPLSGWIMKALPGVGGLAGWQWMFLIEAIPSIIVGLAVIFYLPDRIRHAKWLTEPEKRVLEAGIERDTIEKTDLPLRQLFTYGKVWLLALIYFCLVMGLYGISFWLPSLIKETGVQDPLRIGLLTVIPYAAAVAGMVLTSRSADRRRERRLHVAIPATIGAIGLVLSALYSHNTLIAMAALTVATAGIITSLPLFWSLPTAFLGGVAAAAGIALINSLGNLAGFVSPYMVGWIKDATQSTNMGMYALAASLLTGAILTMTLSGRLVNR
ncbi:MAG: Permease of the major facilitator superfamily [Herminiimonas sp.]|nr:Permease of the major facilitator superfamily [Herminiimonas sp.]